MDCYYHGGSIVFATPFGGFAVTGHRLKCRSKLGRKSVYKKLGQLTLAWALLVFLATKKLDSSKMKMAPIVVKLCLPLRRL